MKRTPDTRQSIFRNPAALGFFARRHRLVAVVLGSAGIVFACVTMPAVSSPPIVSVSDGRYAMGTVLEITLETQDTRAGRRWMESAYEDVAQWERLVSRMQPESEVARLNRTAGQGPQKVDPLVADLISRAIQYSRLTGGSFDISIGPLVDLWIRAARQNQLPSPQSIQKARASVGADRIQVTENLDVELLEAGMSIDLGGIAKGWALDQLAEKIKQDGGGSALLSFGQSSVWAIGNPVGDSGWRLALRDPRGGIAGVLSLRDLALSVSSSLGQTSEIEGRKYGHVVNPLTGEALQRAVQVAVVATDASLAEALSTALVVQELDAGLVWVDAAPGVEALWIDENGERTASRGWQERTQFEPTEAVAVAQRSISRGSSKRLRKF